MDNTKFAGNTDTGLLKTIAFITMMADHVGYLFFPGQMLWRIFGRIAFPIFAYGTALGAVCTKDMKKYFLRLLAFSLVSQIPYTFCFYPNTFGPIFGGVHLNIGFTMLLGLWAIFGIQSKKNLHTVLALALSFLPAVEYGFYGVGFILLAYILSSQEKDIFICVSFIWLVSPLFEFFISGIFDPQCFAVLALFFIAAKTKSGIKIPRWLNYGFYPAHLCLLILLKNLIL